MEDKNLISQECLTLMNNQKSLENMKERLKYFVTKLEQKLICGSKLNKDGNSLETFKCQNKKRKSKNIILEIHCLKKEIMITFLMLSAEMESWENFLSMMVKISMKLQISFVWKKISVKLMLNKSNSFYIKTQKHLLENQ